MKNAVFAGTFDPVTKGHESVIEKASKLFDTLTVAICINPDKKTLFTVDTRFEMLKSVCAKYKNVVVTYHEGWLVDLMKSVGAIYNVRGVRNAIDYEYENDMHYYNEKTYPELVTLYIPCSKSLKDVSSTAVKKAIASGRYDDEYLSKSVIEIIKKQGR